MVLQVLADALELMADLDAERREQVAGADPRQLQDLRGADGACREDHLAGGIHRSHRSLLAQRQAGDTRTIEEEALNQSARLDLEVLPVRNGVQEAPRRIPAHARALVHVEIAAALVVAPVAIVDLGDASL